MAEKNLPITDEFLAAVDEQQAQLLSSAADALDARIKALQVERKESGEEDKLIDARLAQAEHLSASVATLVIRNRQLPDPKPDVFIVHGQVTGAPRSRKKYRLTVTDPANKKCKIPPVSSDENGFFTLTIRAKEFPDLVQNKSDLFLRITDSSGREVFAPADPVRVEPGGLALFSTPAV
jgi:hypothetical protein